MKSHIVFSIKGLTLLAMLLAFAAPTALAADDPITFLKPVKSAPRDPDKVSKVTIRGYGNGPVDTLDATGKVIESVDQASLFLNQSPPEVIARRTAALEDRRERANQYRIDKQEQARADAEAAATAADAAASEQRIADLEATIRAMENALRKPVRDRYTGRMISRL